MSCSTGTIIAMMEKVPESTDTFPLTSKQLALDNINSVDQEMEQDDESEIDENPIYWDQGRKMRKVRKITSPKKKRVASPKKKKSVPKKRVSSPKTQKRKRMSAQKKSPRACVRQSTKKYRERPSPAFPANQCCGSVMMGNDGNMYESRPDINRICTWKKL